VEQELIHADLARLHVIRPAYGADAHRAVAQRDHPVPAVIEPVDADVALVAPRATHRALEMAEHGRAAVHRVAAFYVEAMGEEGVAPGGVHHEARLPALRRSEERRVGKEWSGRWSAGSSKRVQTLGV